MTYMWQTEPSVFRIQTGDPSIARKLDRRMKPKLVGWGINKYIVIYELRSIRPDNARRTLSLITGQKVIFNALKGEYETKTHSHMTMTETSEVGELFELANNE
jgi:hypothetical protein